VNEITRLDIKIRSGIMIAELIKDGAGVAGAVGLDLETDTMLVIAARAVILATGRAGNLYHLTTNPAGLTGDGYALAYRAGVRLQDMEFIQVRVCMISPKGMRGTPPREMGW
jgi:succinate dehydrogenase/fumarate reductase flavoprotein subunit